MVGQRDQTSVWDQEEGCGMEMAAVGQRGKAQDGRRYCVWNGGGCHMAERMGTGHRIPCGTEGTVVGQRVLFQDGVNGQGMEGSITGWEQTSQDGWDAGHHHGWRVQQWVAVTDSPCLGGREPVHPAGGEPAGCQ